MSNDAQNLAVLFADVSGSTRLYEIVGDADALATIGHCLALVRIACEDYGGRVVKTIGDEVMAVFPSPDDATKAAVEMQTRICRLPPVGSVRLAIRVGFHFGPALEVEGDVYGDSVNVAARMVALAKGEQVILTAQAAAVLTPVLRSRLREIDSLTVKGKRNDIGTFELMWRESDEDMTALATRPVRPPARVRLRLGSREIVLDEGEPTIRLGRDPQNEVVITERKASRMHARIERRRDKFVLVDESSNGTYVTIEGEPEIHLRREEMILRGRGHVSFGRTYAGDTGEVLQFSCTD